MAFAAECALIRALPTKVVSVSGTLVTRSIKDYQHLAQWALGAKSPLPLTHPLTEGFKKAFDKEDGAPVDGHTDYVRGWILRKFPESGNPRTAFKQRLRSTAGVVGTSDTGVNASRVLLPRRPDVPEALASLGRLLAHREVMVAGMMAMELYAAGENELDETFAMIAPMADHAVRAPMATGRG